MKTKRFVIQLVSSSVATVCLVIGLGLVPELPYFGTQEAQAVIGRPLTPVSYAGVARRTVRRGAYYGGAAVATTAVVGTAAVATTAAVAHSAYIYSLPGGCSTYYSPYTYYHCGSTYYRPVYDGPDVVYTEMDKP